MKLRQSPRDGFGGIAFLHTAPGHVATFGVLMAETAPNVPVRQTVRAELLDAVGRDGGELSAAVIAQARADLAELAANGARVVVCTCLTIGRCLDDDTAPPFPGAVFQRIDAPMADAAARLPGPILVAATVPRSLEASCDLIVQAGRPRSDLAPLFIPGAWPLFESGERAAYKARVVAAVRDATGQPDPSGLVVPKSVVLAQASMAPAVADLRDLEDRGIPVLCSPRLGVAAAVAAWRDQVSAASREQAGL